MANTVKIAFIGDLMCQMQQIWAVKNAACGYDVIFGQVRHLWENCDYVVGNLETPVTGSGFRLAFEEMRFNAPVEFLEAIKRAGIDFVTTANNHILDRGAKGLDATLVQIAKVGLESTGAYDIRERSDEVFLKEIGGLKVAFVACTYDTNSGRRSDMLAEEELWKIDYIHHPTPFLGDWRFAVKRTIKNLLPYRLKKWLKLRMNGRACQWGKPQTDSFMEVDFYKEEHGLFLRRVCGKIKRAKTKADIVIALPHIGGQYNAVPGPWQLKVTDALIDAGADVVVANHAHTPLKLEMRKGALVAHCLGNFCFTPRVGFYNDKCQADYSIVLFCEFNRADGKLVGWKYSIVKTVTNDNGVSIVRPTSDADLVDLTAICARVGVKGDIEELEV